MNPNLSLALIEHAKQELRDACFELQRGQTEHARDNIQNALIDLRSALQELQPTPGEGFQSGAH